MRSILCRIDIRPEILEELEYPRGSRYVDPENCKTVGKQVGADSLLSGNVASIAKEKDDTKDIYYKVTLNLVDLETGLIVWADEKEISERED